MRQCVLVLGAHPDDCEIGAGGTIAAYTQRGHRVVMVTLRIPCDCGDPCQEEEKSRRRREGERAAAILGAELHHFNLAREAIKPNARLVGAIDKLLADLQPAAVYTHWIGDSHPEHVAATRAVLAATRHNRCSVYQYEATLPGGVTPHAFHAQKFVDVSDTIEQKMDGLACHETQLETYGQGWLEAIRGRAAHRGFQMGRRYAEAFEVVKELAEIPDLRPR
jgi:LmbE family N-acetylglucosaminyl deacetylase